MIVGFKQILKLSLPLAVILIVSIFVQAEQELAVSGAADSGPGAAPFAERSKMTEERTRVIEKHGAGRGESRSSSATPTVEDRDDLETISGQGKVERAAPANIPSILDRPFEYFEVPRKTNQQNLGTIIDDRSNPASAAYDDSLQSFSEDVVDLVMGGVGVRNGPEEDTVQPLAIVTSDIKPGVVGTPYSDTVNVTGGVAPYRFSAAGLPAGFSISEGSGEITGTAELPSESTVMIAVIDNERRTQRRAVDLIIRTTPIFIASSAIGDGTVGEPFFSRLIAQGGRPPYSWSVSSGRLPTGLVLSADGVVSGASVEEHSGIVRVMVRDEDGGIDQADLRINFRIAGTPEEVAGGDASSDVNESPVESNDEVGDKNSSENIPTDNMSGGTAGGGAGTGNASLRTFIAAPGDSKVGLAWAFEAGQAVAIYRSTVAYPTGSADGELVCGGVLSGVTNCVDRNLENGITYFYSALLIDSGGAPLGQSPLNAVATPAAVALSGPADPFADEISEFTPLDPACFNCNLVSKVIVGPPQGKGEALGSFDVVSLGAKINSDSGRSGPYGGSITVRFTNNIVVDGPGADFTVFENPIRLAGTDYYFVEPAVVEVSANGVDFYRFPFDFVPHYDAGGNLNLGNPLSYAKGFAGVKPVYSNNGAPDPTRPNLSGGDQFDLSELPAAPLSWIQYVRITSTGDGWLRDMNGDLVRHSNDPPTFGASGLGNSGFDFDAIAAVNY